MRRWVLSAVVAIFTGGCAATPAPAPPVLSPAPPPVTHDVMDADDVIRGAAGTTRPVARFGGRRVAPRRAVAVRPAAPPLPKPKPQPELWTGGGRCEGIASWYGGKFIGRRTANGERYTGKQLTAAHRALRFGTRVKVTNLKNGLDVVVRINDRGPFVAGRVIDLSPRAARELNMLRDGVVPVRLEVVD